MTQIAPYLEMLNNEQRQAVLHNGKGLLILAGAGSGKTRVITTKIAYLIREQGIDPRSILAVTFTNKAAREMADRARRIDERAADAMMRTFHSFGAWFLRRNANAAGLSSNFVIYDEDDMVSLLGSIDETSPRPVIKEYAFLISRAKDYFLSPDDPKLDLIDYRPEFRKIYADYEERLKRIGNVDFGDLIKKPVELLRSNPDIARRFHDRFKVILVDEYQDSNIAQEQLLVCLTAPETYLCVVGDDDQSIYRFRGAEVQNILEFPKRFPGTDIIRLEQNYRSFSSILEVASSVVDYNEGRLGKKLRTERGKGKIPTLAFLPDQDEEAVFCAELIQNAVKKGADYSDWAVLYRTNAQSLGFETELLRKKIPYRVVGSLKFYQREEIKDALALLALLVNPFDEVAFRRIINKPVRGIGATSMDKIIAAAYSTEFFAAEPDGQPIKGFIAAACGLTLSAKAAAGVEAFAAFMEKARAMLDSGKADASAKAGGSSKKGKSANADKSSDRPDKSAKNIVRARDGLSVCVASLIMDSGLAHYHSTRADAINEHQRLGNLQELVNAASLYPATREGLAEFLEHIELDRSIQDDKDKSNVNVVSLLTLHNTKGLEFKRVILTGLEQGVFPRDEKAGEDLEEERRLFYVGTTRAMDELYFCSCAERRLYGKTCPMTPSRFLFEADKSFLRVIGNAPAGFGGKKNVSAHSNRIVTSSDGRWKTGDRLFHDDHGYGGVIAITEGEEGPVINVKFDNGYEKSFLSLYQSGNFVKTESEY